MRALLLALFIGAGIGLAGNTSAIAAPFSGVAIEGAGDSAPLAEPAHCRRYPHRHMRARPHGLGFGCPKKVRPARQSGA
jgi:hypothetical protein